MGPLVSPPCFLMKKSKCLMRGAQHSTSNIKRTEDVDVQLEPLNSAASEVGFISTRHYVPFWVPAIMISPP